MILYMYMSPGDWLSAPGTGADSQPPGDKV